MPHVLDFFVCQCRFWGSNLGPHTCLVNTTECSLSPFQAELCYATPADFELTVLPKIPKCSKCNRIADMPTTFSALSPSSWPLSKAGPLEHGCEGKEALAERCRERGFLLVYASTQWKGYFNNYVKKKTSESPASLSIILQVIWVFIISNADLLFCL